jgi:DNA-binding GntR family transcriptional regulator
MKVTRVFAPVREQVVEAIRAEIISGGLAPGQRLIERELREELDVSRTTLREAYRQLEAEGFITITPHKGPTVTVMTDDEARSVYEVREALECFAVRLFVKRADESTLDRLQEAVTRLRDAHLSGEVPAMLEAKHEFYDVLYAGADNDVLRAQAALLQSRLYRLRARSLARNGRPGASIAEIEQVMERIAERDAEAASTLWGQHIHRAALAALEQPADPLTEPTSATS